MARRQALSDAVGAAARIQRHDLRRDLRQFRLRHRLPRAGPARSRAGDLAVQRLPHPHRDRDAVAAHAAAIATTRWRSPSISPRIPSVGWVSYAGLPGNRYHELAKRYCPKGAGGVFTFGVKGGYEAGVALVGKLQLFSHVANIGDTRSLVIHPASTTHRQLADAQKIAAGAGPDVVRLSIGLEDVEDLIADLDQALE